MMSIKSIPMQYLWGGLCVAAASVGLAFFLHGRIAAHALSGKDAEQFIVSAIEDCYQASNQNACYAKAASTFAERLEPAVVLKTIAANEKRPRIFQVCHTVLHFFGRDVFDREKDVSKTLSEGDATCFAGYYHGALEGYFIQNNFLSQSGDDSAFANKIVSLCQQDNKKEQDECLHGLGHALMFATNSELPRALALCDVFPRDKATWCYSGVFMENSTSATNKDHPSKYLKKNDPKYPCSILDDKYLSMCYTLQTQYVVDQSSGNWNQAFAFCEKIPRAYRKDCAMAVGGSIAGYSQDPRVMRDNCEQTTDYGDQEACIMGAVGSMGERYNNLLEHIVPFCSWLDEHKASCYRRMTSLMAHWTRDASTLRAGCSRIPEASYRESCLRAIKI